MKADVAVVCFCSARGNMEELLRLAAITGPLPTLTCSKTVNLDFVRLAIQKGVDRFLSCNMEAQKIKDIVFEAIRRGGLKEYLQSYYPGGHVTSPHVNKMINEIVHVFPHRLKESEMAQRLRISRSWLQKLCRRVFGNSYTRLTRHLWVYQALRMMQHTTLDNGEIALQLNYSEESNMARDFRKALGYSPTEARMLLAKQNPEELLRRIF
ncbi:MAG: AraC family transcriptional regulator [candidate division KSB1 bacterium]|nr:AraC family transcriptional regulator [candidate division KSB1 bacterium]MDZ7301404.1 AraC family transcriptional regulator [candidate division KSB1 bacterium]MDZ7310711.1 AraC family transcriptional regulator [candidate division KSB1 bacterium]